MRGKITAVCFRVVTFLPSRIGASRRQGVGQEAGMEPVDMLRKPGLIAKPVSAAGKFARETH